LSSIVGNEDDLNSWGVFVFKFTKFIFRNNILWNIKMGILFQGI